MRRRASESQKKRENSRPISERLRADLLRPFKGSKAIKRFVGDVCKKKAIKRFAKRQG